MPTAMFTAEELALIRRAYAHQVVATAATTNPRIEAAFAVVPREKFLPAAMADRQSGRGISPPALL